MARTSTYTCATCGTTFEFCLKCQVTKPNYDAENFCCSEHEEIYRILSKHGCNLITATEALEALAVYDIDNIILTEDILAHIAKIKSEAGIKVETAPVEEVIVEESFSIVEEQPIVKSNKKNKKKW